MFEVEENSISNSIDLIKKPVYRSIQISLDNYFNPPELPFYWRLNYLNQVINIENTEKFFEKTKSFIQSQNILFEFNSNCFNCSVYDNEIQENIKFNLYFWNKKELNENEFIFEFQSLNCYNFNNIFRIYDIYNSFCILFGGNIIKYNLIQYNKNNLPIHSHMLNTDEENDYLVSSSKISIPNQIPIIKCGT